MHNYSIFLLLKFLILYLYIRHIIASAAKRSRISRRSFQLQDHHGDWDITLHYTAIVVFNLPHLKISSLKSLVHLAFPSVNHKKSQCPRTWVSERTRSPVLRPVVYGSVTEGQQVHAWHCPGDIFAQCPQWHPEETVAY